MKKAIVFLLALTASGAAFAGGRVHFGIGIGFGPYWGPGPFWGPAYYYPPPVYYYPPPPAYYYPPPPPAAPIPGPGVATVAWPPLVVPGDNKSFDDFRADDGECRGQSVSDASYQQCMYARGHKLAPRGAQYSAPTR